MNISLAFMEVVIKWTGRCLEIPTVTVLCHVKFPTVLFRAGSFQKLVHRLWIEKNSGSRTIKPNKGSTPSDQNCVVRFDCLVTQAMGRFFYIMTLLPKRWDLHSTYQYYIFRLKHWGPMKVTTANWGMLKNSSLNSYVFQSKHTSTYCFIRVLIISQLFYMQIWTPPA